MSFDPSSSDEPLMREALALAAHAQSLGEVPIGALIVHAGAVIARGYNRREIDRNPLAHAEILAIAEAAAHLRRWRLAGCTLYVTLEPCPMCAGALVNSRIDRLVYATRDRRAGAIDTHYQIGHGLPLNHTLQIKEGVLRDDAAAMLTAFFVGRRQKNET